MTEYWDRFFCENHLLKTGLLLVYVGFIMAIHRIWSFNGYLRFDGHVTRNHCRKLNTCLNLPICWGFPTPFVVDRFYSVLIITFGMRPHEIKLNLCGFLFLVRWWVIGCSRWVIWFVHLILWLFFFTQLENGLFLCRLLASKLSKSRGPRLLLFYPRRGVQWPRSFVLARCQELSFWHLAAVPKETIQWYSVFPFLNPRVKYRD
jgi:hypothetical protein